MGSCRIEPRYFDDNDHSKGYFHVLCPESGRSFVEDLIRTDKKRLSRILVTIKRIYDNGCAFGFASQTIKRIIAGNSAIAVFEVRIKGTVIRVASYLHENWIPIYLFDFDTHQGSKNNLPKHIIDRAIDLAAIAQQQAVLYDFKNYKGAR